MSLVFFMDYEVSGRSSEWVSVLYSVGGVSFKDTFMYLHEYWKMGKLNSALKPVFLLLS